jgi:hypothetical protein
LHPLTLTTKQSTTVSMRSFSGRKVAIHILATCPYRPSKHELFLLKYCLHATWSTIQQ